MDNVVRAQKLLTEYEKDGKVSTLENALQILDEIIENQGHDAKKALNLRDTVGKRVIAETDEIARKSNLPDFAKILSNSTVEDKFQFLSSSVGPDVAKKMWELILIRVNYFG